MVPSLPLLSCESSVSVKENPDRKKKLISSTLEQNKLARENWRIVLVHTFLRIQLYPFYHYASVGNIYIDFHKKKQTFHQFDLRLAARNFIKKETLAQVFSCEFCKISRSTFFYRTPLVATSVNFSKLLLTHLNLAVLSCKNQSIDLQWISLDWFLYNSKISLIG